MRIMCLNGWGGTLSDALLPYLAEADPDILCLQEVIHTPAAEKDWLEYRDGDHVLPQRARMLEEVQAALPGHVAVFCPAAQGVLWDGARPVPSQWGLASFVRSGIPIVGQMQGFVHKAFSPKGYGDHPRSRSAHALRIHDFAADRSLVVAHMHGLRVPGDKSDTPERLAQARRFRGMAEAVREPGDPMVLCGDFNLEPGSETFAVLEEIGLKELVTGHGYAGTRSSHYRKPGRFADYMFVTETLPLRRFEVVAAPEVSDHLPLVLEI